MQEIQEHRKNERDYTSLVDQIRCLKRRYDMLVNGEVVLYKPNPMQDGEEAMQKQQLQQSNEEIQRLKYTLDEVRSQIQQTKREQEVLKEDYIELHRLEGEKNAELAAIKGETTK